MKVSKVQKVEVQIVFKAQWSTCLVAEKETSADVRKIF